MLLNTLSIMIMTMVTWDAVRTSNSQNDDSHQDENDCSQSWNGWSPNDNNDRYQRSPLPVTLPSRKSEFKQLWYTKLSGPVLVTPTIYQDRVYVSTFTGSFYCLRADNGNIVWQKNLSDVMNNGLVYFSRSSPLIYNDLIILGIMETALFKPKLGLGSYVIALNRFTGILR